MNLSVEPNPSEPLVLASDAISQVMDQAAVPKDTTRGLPRVAFLGLGWIGRMRLQSVLEQPQLQVAALCDLDTEAIQSASDIVRSSQAADTEPPLLTSDLRLLTLPTIDAVVIATPSGQHYDQVSQCLRAGKHVFCQKPLAANREETEHLVELAKANQCLLAVDYCYRHIEGVAAARDLVQSGQLGPLASVDAKFHNAYAPSQGWAYQVPLSAGGCAIDLATHLVDLIFWICGDASVSNLRSQLYRDALKLALPTDQVENAAMAQWLLNDETHVSLSCSWNDHIGCDAEIELTVKGSAGSVKLRNLGGSFYHFATEYLQRNQHQTLGTAAMGWSSRALQQWIERLNDSPSFDPHIASSIRVAATIDEIYSR